MNSGKGVFLSVFRAPFYDCFQIFNRNAFLWITTLFGANTPESSKICQKVEAFFIKCPEILRSETFLLSLHAKNTNFLKCIPIKKTKKDTKTHKQKKIKSVKCKKFIREDKCSQNCLKSIVWVKVSSFQISCLTKFQSYLMT